MKIKIGDQEERDPIQDYAHLKAGLSKAQKEYLESQGFNWTTFKELEEMVKANPEGQYQTSEGIVQVIESPSFLRKYGQRIGTTNKLHFTSKER